MPEVARPRKWETSRAQQEQVDAFSDFVWAFLEALLQKGAKKRPPVYLYLSPQSKRSLKNRSREEVEWVHFQQERAGGISLKKPPAAWVSKLTQVPEEVAHLFALTHQKPASNKTMSLLCETRFTCLHECFGSLVHSLVFGDFHSQVRSRKRFVLSEESFWDLAHQEGNLLGLRLGELLFQEQLPVEQLRLWFNSDWLKPATQRRLLKKLYRICAIRESAAIL
ncbi:MAG: hypothetical protein EA369_06655 [Bradymonadales bacterium]|nr:MAG: hypothetical protein EA369_06655 [Bradymonadales bacterium]